MGNKPTVLILEPMTVDNLIGMYLATDPDEATIEATVKLIDGVLTGELPETTRIGGPVCPYSRIRDIKGWYAASSLVSFIVSNVQGRASAAFLETQCRIDMKDERYEQLVIHFGVEVERVRVRTRESVTHKVIQRIREKHGSVAYDKGKIKDLVNQLTIEAIQLTYAALAKPTGPLN